MDALEELTSHLSGSSRAIVVSDREVDLRPGTGDISLFILKIGEGSLAAGGRGGGFGERKVTSVFCFARSEGTWSRVFGAEGERAAVFEVPYYVSRLPMTMADGNESMGYGVVDAQLVKDFAERAKAFSSA